MNEQQAEPFLCPKCGAPLSAEREYGRYATVCPSCKKTTLENEFWTYSALAEPSDPPEGCRVVRAEGDGPAAFLVPRVGATGVHYAPFMYTILWTFTSACGVAAGWQLGGLFILPAIFLCLPTLAIFVGAVSSLIETQRVEVTGDAVRVTKKGLFFRPRGRTAFEDIELVSIQDAPPLNPLNPGRFLLHTPESANELGGVPVPTVTSASRVLRFGEFLSDAEKTWLVREVKSAVLRQSGRRV